MKKFFAEITLVILFVLVAPSISNASNWPSQKVNNQNNPIVFDASSPKPSSSYEIQINNSSLASAQPISANGMLFYVKTFDNPLSVTLVAADIKTGSTIWQKNYSRQILNLIYDNGKLYFGSDFIYCLNANDGTEIWRVTNDMVNNLIDNSGVYAVDSGRVYAHETQRNYSDKRLLILDSSSGAKISNLGNFDVTNIQTILFDANNFYTFYAYGSYSHIRAFSKSTLAQIWVSPICQSGTSLRPLLDSDRGAIYTASASGVFCVNNVSNGAQLAYKTGYFQNGLVRYGDRLYGFSGSANGAFYSIPVNNFNDFSGTRIFDGSKFSSDPIIVNDTLYGGSSAGSVYGKNLETGAEQVWPAGNIGGYVSYLAYASGKMIIVNRISQFDTRMIVKDIAEMSLRPGNYAVTLESPYKTDGEYLSLLGQLHAHYVPDFDLSSIFIDSQKTPFDVVNRYKNQGYNFVALTEHDVLTNNPTVDGITYIENAEESTEVPSKHHILSIGITRPIDENANDQQRVDQIIDQVGLAIFSHPNANKYNLSQDELLRLQNYLGIEIYNSSVDKWHVFAGESYALDKLDSLTTMGKNIWATSGDDYTPWDGGFDGGAVVVFSKVNTQADIMQNLKVGNFYALQGSQAPRIDLAINGNTITINSDRQSSIKFIGNGGKTLQMINNVASASYIATGDENYVRAEIEAGGKMAWTQPIKVNKTRIAQTSSSNFHYSDLGQGGLTSNTTAPVNASIVSASEYPAAAPPLGYMSPVYSFSTSGQVLNGTNLSISYSDREVYTSPNNLAIYTYNETSSTWEKVESHVDASSQTVSANLSHFSLYTLSADQPADTEKPTVTLISPTNLSNLSGNIKFVVDANDYNAVTKVKFSIDNKDISKDVTNDDEGWTKEINGNDYAIGDHNLKIEAEDFSGNIGTFETNFNIANSSFIAPTINIDAPTDNQYLNNNFIVSGTYSSQDNVQSISIFMDNIYVADADFANGTFRKEIDFSQFKEGQHQFKVTLRDENDNIAETIKTINIGEELKVNIILPQEKTYMHSEQIKFQYRSIPVNAEGITAKLDGDIISNNSAKNAYDMSLGQHKLIVEKHGKIFAERNFEISTNLLDQIKLTQTMFQTGHIKNNGIKTSIQAHLLTAEIFELLHMTKMRNQFILKATDFVNQQNKQKKPLIDDYARNILVEDSYYLLKT